MTVLIVDDAGIMRMILKDILVRYGKYSQNDIFEAADGEEAISKYKEHSPELVLCDIAMPDMNGIEVVKVLKGLNPDVKIIMCTASTDQSDVRECIKAGARDYIIKPPKPERVIQAIQVVTGQVFEGVEVVGKSFGAVQDAEDGYFDKVNTPDDDFESNEGVVTRQEFDELKGEVEKLKRIISGMGK